VSDDVLRDLEAHYRTQAHSIFSPSSASRWARCTGSLVPNLLEPDKAGEEAAWGTVAHRIVDDWFNTDERAAIFGDPPPYGDEVDALIGRTEVVDGFTITVTAQMIDFCRQYVAWIGGFQAHEHHHELRLESDWAPIAGQGGTADDVLLLPGHLIIADFKTGYIPVHAKENYQLLIYAIGAYVRFNGLWCIKKVTLAIGQPVHDRWETWSLDIDDLMLAEAFFRDKAREAWSLDAPRVASEEACRYCKVIATCPAMQLLTESFADDAFEIEGEYQAVDVQAVTAFMPEPEIIVSQRLESGKKRLPNLHVNALARMYGYRKVFEKFFAAVEAEMFRRAFSLNEKIPGYKLVDGRASRSFKLGADLTEEAKFVGLNPADTRKVTTISPAEMEELLIEKLGYKRKDALALVGSLVERTPGKPTLAPESDDRESVTNLADDSFDIEG
jgi:hypothetical protein